MATPKVLKYGDVIVTGHGQLMRDGSWTAKCVITDHTGPHTDERLLTGTDTFQSELEAVTAALHIGRQWVDKHYPSP
jgi:hypothetical protein